MANTTPNPVDWVPVDLVPDDDGSTVVYDESGVPIGRVPAKVQE